MYLGGYIPVASQGGGSAIGSGAVTSGEVGSGTVQGFFGDRAVASGTLGVFDFGSGAVIAGAVGSGAVLSGNVASGQIGPNHLGSGVVQSGAILSGSVGSKHLGSGVLQAGINMIIDGGGSALGSGIKGYVTVPFPSTLLGLSIFSDQSGGSVRLGIWKDTYANFPPTSGDTIAPSGVPLISGAIRNTYSGEAALSGWTTSFARGDVLAFVVHSGLTMTQVSVSMQLAQNGP